MSIIENARAFSIGAHEALQQKRKYTGEPYYTHTQWQWGLLSGERMVMRIC